MYNSATLPEVASIIKTNKSYPDHVFVFKYQQLFTVQSVVKYQKINMYDDLRNATVNGLWKRGPSY